MESMDAYERSQVADALKEEEYTTGDMIINQGEEGDKFYMIVSGACTAIKDGAEVGIGVDV